VRQLSVSIRHPHDSNPASVSPRFASKHDNHSVLLHCFCFYQKLQQLDSTTVKQIIRRLGKVKMLRGTLGVAPQPSAINIPHGGITYIYANNCLPKQKANKEGNYGT
jgi:hypothetical protein